MTAEVEPLRQNPTAEAEDVVRASIRALIRGNDMRVEDVAPLLGITPATLYRRLAARGRVQPFTAGELIRAAAVFNVSTDALASGLGGLFGVPRGQTAAAGPARLSPVAGAGIEPATSRL